MAQSELQLIKEELLAKLASKEEIAEIKKRVSSLEQKADRHSETLSKLTSLVLDLRENSATKKVLNEKFELVLQGQDRLAKIYDEKTIEMAAQDAKTYRLESYIKEESQRNDLQDKILQRHDARIKKLENVTS